MRHLLMVAAIAALPGTALAQDAAAGRAVAQTWCANCHTVEARPVTSADQAPGFVLAHRKCPASCHQSPHSSRTMSEAIWRSRSSL